MKPEPGKQLQFDPAAVEVCARAAASIVAVFTEAARGIARAIETPDSNGVTFAERLRRLPRKV